MFAPFFLFRTLTTSQAAAHMGETVTVCGIVASEHFASRSRGKPHFIDLDSAYPHPLFTILIWDADMPNVGALPRLLSHLCVSGTIREYRGIPEVVVKSSRQLSR